MTRSQLTSAVDGANRSPAASTNHATRSSWMRKRYTRVQNSAAQASEQETSRAHQEDKLCFGLSQGNKWAKHTHAHSHNKKQQRKKRTIQIFKVPSVSLSLGECAGACECVRDRICMSVAIKVCSPSQLFLGLRSGFDWLPLGKLSTLHLGFFSQPQAKGWNFSVRLWWDLNGSHCKRTRLWLK